MLRNEWNKWEYVCYMLAEYMCGVEENETILFSTLIVMLLLCKGMDENAWKDVRSGYGRIIGVLVS